MSEPSVVPLFEVILFERVEFTTASGHNVRVPTNSIGHVEVINTIRQQTVIKFSVA